MRFGSTCSVVWAFRGRRRWDRAVEGGYRRAAGGDREHPYRARGDRTQDEFLHLEEGPPPAGPRPQLEGLPAARGRGNPRLTGEFNSPRISTGRTAPCEYLAELRG